MKQLRLLVVAIVCACVAALAASAAHADPMGDGAITLTLFNCSGPAGTPASFQVTKMLNGGSGFHLVDGTGVFKRTSVTDLVTGESASWGNDDTKPVLTCNVVSIASGHLLLVTGFITSMGDG